MKNVCHTVIVLPTFSNENSITGLHSECDWAWNSRNEIRSHELLVHQLVCVWCVCVCALFIYFAIFDDIPNNFVPCMHIQFLTTWYHHVIQDKHTNVFELITTKLWINIHPTRHIVLWRNRFKHIWTLPSAGTLPIIIFDLGTEINANDIRKGPL